MFAPRPSFSGSREQMDVKYEMELGDFNDASGRDGGGGRGGDITVENMKLTWEEAQADAISTFPLQIIKIDLWMAG